MHSNGFKKIRIYYDYEGLSKWILGEWTAKTDVSQLYVKLYKAKFQDVLNVDFVKVPSHSNISYNDKADELAKSALKKQTENSDSRQQLVFCPILF